MSAKLLQLCGNVLSLQCCGLPPYAFFYLSQMLLKCGFNYHISLPLQYNLSLQFQHRRLLPASKEPQILPRSTLGRRPLSTMTPPLPLPSSRLALLPRNPPSCPFLPLLAPSCPFLPLFAPIYPFPIFCPLSHAAIQVFHLHYAVLPLQPPSSYQLAHDCCCVVIFALRLDFLKSMRQYTQSETCRVILQILFVSYCMMQQA
jgi:hypothetical protein